jgi:Tfp pilus assembly protein PilX
MKMKKNKKEGVSIIATVAIMLILSVLGIVAVSLLGSSSNLAVGYLQSQQAFYISQAGIEWYLEKLQNDTDWSDNTNESAKNFAGGAFTITIASPLANSIEVTSTATLAGYESQTMQRVTHTHVSRIPTAFNSALYIEGDIQDSGADYTVTGGQQSHASDLPTVDFSYYQGIADHVISGNYAFNAGTYSGIWYVDGAVNIASGVTLNGTIVATGQISLNGTSNVTITATSPYPALVCEGNFHFQNTDNITVTGLIYVGANATGNFLSQKAENVNFIGTIIVRGNFNIQNANNVNIVYDSSIRENPPPGFSSTAYLTVVVSWEEVI